jgi:hypothetical protein
MRDVGSLRLDGPRAGGAQKRDLGLATWCRLVDVDIIQYCRGMWYAYTGN